jgi:S1-C subfamily serine protease
LWLIAIVGLIAAASPTWTGVEDPGSTAGKLQQTDQSRVYEAAKRSVFLIEANAGAGSGFLVDESGLVLTNSHVVGDSYYIGVQIDGQRKVGAVLVAVDEERDIAVIRVHPDTVVGLPALPLRGAGAQATELAVGQLVLAIGNPFALGSVLTDGIISEIDENVLFSDVALNPGNSGGPVLDMAGRVIGIATFGLNAEGGTGLSGIVRIERAQDLLEDARATLDVAAVPSSEALPRRRKSCGSISSTPGSSTFNSSPLP